MKLKTLLQDIDTVAVRGDTNIPVTGVAYDSRQVKPGDIFVCLEGLTVDGHVFGPATVEAGATSLVVHRWVESPATQVRVKDSRVALAHLSTSFFGSPFLDLTLLGVTGTNGKTTVTHFLKSIGETAGFATEVLGTLGDTGFTTPEAPHLQEILRDAVSRKMAWVAMECSSHALAQQRTLGTRFDVVLFTNLSRDHLDYHRTMEAYFQAKARLFDEAYRKERGVAVIHIDDPYGRRLFQQTSGGKVSYGFSEDAQIRALDLSLEADQSTYTLAWGDARVRVTLKLPGRYNVLNALAAQSAALQLGVDLESTARGVERADSIPGRMERVLGKQPFQVFVDYAHTPDGLGFALSALREITTGRLWVVFGCGGNRDQGKRPLMGTTAEQLADCVVVTSDNPRSEDPQVILDEITQDLLHPAATHVDIDRESAMRWALRGATSGDTVLIAGKGHERTQILKEGAVDFDDRMVATQLIRELYEPGN